MADTAQDQGAKAGDSVARLRSALRERSVIAARMSEQLKSELSAVLRQTSYLADTDLDPSQTTAVRQIAELCKQQLADLANIADLSKLEPESPELEHRDFELHTTMRTPVAAQAFAASDRGVTLRCYVHRDVPRHVVGDDARLRQILGSLLENFINHTREDDIAIYVELEKERTRSYEIRVTISDTELGPPRHYEVGLFEFVERGLEGAAAPHTSLGISVINDLLNLMGGRLGMYGEDERGCAVWFKVELAASDPDVERVMLAPHHPILLVSDDPDSIPQVLMALQHRHYTVELEDDRTNLTERLEKSPYSLVLMNRQQGHMATVAVRPDTGEPRSIPLLGVPRNSDGDLDESELIRLVQRWVGPMQS